MLRAPLGRRQRAVIDSVDEPTRRSKQKRDELPHRDVEPPGKFFSALGLGRIDQHDTTDVAEITHPAQRGGVTHVVIERENRVPWVQDKPRIRLEPRRLRQQRLRTNVGVADQALASVFLTDAYRVRFADGNPASHWVSTHPRASVRLRLTRPMG